MEIFYIPSLLKLLAERQLLIPCEFFPVHTLLFKARIRRNLSFCSWSSWTNGPKTSHIFQNFTESQRCWLFSKIDLAIIQANISLIKASNRSTNKKCETCSKLTIKTSERCPWRQSRAFIFNLEHISPIFLVLLLLTLTSKYFLR